MMRGAVWSLCSHKNSYLCCVLNGASAKHCCSTHSPPPEGVRIGVEVCVDIFLCKVDQEGGKDQDQETDVPGCDQLLREGPRGRY